MQHLSLELIELVAANCQSTLDLTNLARVNRRFHAATARVLYTSVAIRGPRQYASFVGHLDTFSQKGWLKYVRRLDLSSYTARGSGWTEAKAKAIIEPNVLAKLLLQCVNLAQLFVGEELMHAFVEPTVIRAIFNGHPKLEVLDFTGFCDRKFTAAMAHVFNNETYKSDTHTEITAPPLKPTDPMDSLLLQASRSAADVPSELPENVVLPPRLSRISFYMCMALSQEAFFIPFFDRLVANGNKLSRLDLASTKITSSLFKHLDPSSLTHLNLQGCHGVRCCSEIIPFLSQCHQISELNLNMNFNGIAGSNFCAFCLGRLVSLDLPKLRVLDLGGHAHMDEHVLAQISPRISRCLEYFSLAGTKDITLSGLVAAIKKMPILKYLNLSRTWLALDINALATILQSGYPELQVVEIGPFASHRNPPMLQGWTLQSYGRRIYYSRNEVDPRFYYSNKLLLMDEVPSSPMTKYWGYSC